MIAELVAVRHGQSAANVAFPAADAAGRLESGLSGPDADVELTDLGRAQAAALGRYLDGLPEPRRPEIVVCSPFRRARDTWRVAVRAATAPLPEPTVDARLVDRDMGELAMRTRAAIDARWPGENDRRAADWYGYRPPGGEDFNDVRERVAAFLEDAHRRHPGRRLLVVAHDAVVLMVRAVVEQLTPAAITAVQAAAGPVRNASVTRFLAGPHGLRLAEYNSVAHLDGVTAGTEGSADRAG